MHTNKTLSKGLLTRLTVTALLAIPLTVSGCSLFGGGKKKGDGSELSESELNAQREGRFGDGSIPTAEGDGMFKDIRFDYDSSSLSSEARASAEANASVLKGNSSLKVQLEGHCDERGTEQYNLVLGAARARAVRDYLASLGVSKSSLDTISYGENVPLDPSHNEMAWAKNRRVHFSAFDPSLKQ